MASIIRIGPQQWRAQIRRKGYPQQCRTFLTKPDAQAWANQVEADMHRGVFNHRIEAEQLTLRDTIERYLQEVTPTKKGARQERNRLKFWQRTPLANRPIGLLWSGEIAAFRDQRLAQGVSTTTVLQDLRVLSHVFTVARAEWGVQVENPIASIRKPRARRGRDRRLEGDEEARLLASANSPMREMIILAVDTAMRLGELRALRWATIDLAKRLVTLPDSKSGDGRKVPLTRRAVDTLSSLSRREDGFVFPRTHGTSVAHRFGFVCKRAGIEGLRFHDLRHEATSRLFEKGYDTMEVKTITGHKTLQMLVLYTKLRAEDLVKRLD